MQVLLPQLQLLIKKDLVDSLQWHEIFLTGATGFIGLYLLQNLLEKTKAIIHCLVRAKEDDKGNTSQLKEMVFQRVKANMLQNQIWKDEYLDRLIMVIGNLESPNLGLEKAAFDELAQRIDLIFHCGALVHSLLPFSTLFKTNVVGTHTILQLACELKLKPVHYISSFSVLNGIVGNSREEIDEDIDLNSGAIPFDAYGKSKWIAEKLVLEARLRGIPITIYRLGLISGIL